MWIAWFWRYRLLELDGTFFFPQSARGALTTPSWLPLDLSHDIYREVLQFLSKSASFPPPSQPRWAHLYSLPEKRFATTVTIEMPECCWHISSHFVGLPWWNVCHFWLICVSFIQGTKLESKFWNSRVFGVCLTAGEVSVIISFASNNSPRTRSQRRVFS